MKLALQSAINERSPTEWSETCTKNLLRTTGQREPEIDLGPILERRNVHKVIVDPDLPAAARLEPQGSGFCARVRKDRYIKTRGRFSIAHELGHTFFYDYDYDPPRRLERLPYPDISEERLCNRFAADLLMPAGMVETLFHSLSISGCREPSSVLVKIYRLADIFSVSISAMAIRVVKELNLWDGIILTCGWLPKSPENTSEKRKYKWRISRGIYNHELYPELFIPYPNSYIKNNPSIGWSLLDQLGSNMNVGEASNVDIPYEEMYGLGNLSDLLCKKKGKNLFYNVGVMLLRGNRQTKILDNFQDEIKSEGKKSLKFLISVNL